MKSLMAEYDDAAALRRAVHDLRGRGYTQLEAYTPHPVPDLDLALGAPKTKLPWVVAIVGVSGAAAAYALQWLLDAYLYPVDVGGRPPHMPLAFVPITFEMGVLSAGIAALLAVIGFGRLLKLWHPVFEAPGFDSVTRAGYWLMIDARDPRFDEGAAYRDVRATDPVQITHVEGAP